LLARELPGGATVRITSPWDGRARVGLRAVLAAVLAFDTLLVSHFLLGVRPGPASHPHAPAWLLAFAGRTWAIAIAATVAIVSLVAFARRAAAVMPGWIALVCIGVLVEAHAASIEGPYRIFFSASAAMFGWLVGATYARARGIKATNAERHAEFGAAAGLAATYVNAFASKTMSGGIGWTDADSLRAVVLTQHHVGGSWLSNAYADAVADHAWLAGTLVTLTLVAQVSALGYPWHRVTRAISGTLLFAFHANTAILTPLFFPQAMVLLLALSFPWARTAVTTQDAPAAAAARAPRVVLAGALTLCALVAWASPLRSYTLAHHRHGAGASPAPTPPVPPALAPVLDGLHPGVHVGAWEVRSLSGASGGARIDLASGPLVLDVLVLPHGTLAVDPPASTRLYDVLYDTGHPGEAPVPDSDRAAALDAIAASIRSRE
jgi:hypothetical protein